MKYRNPLNNAMESVNYLLRIDSILYYFMERMTMKRVIMNILFFTTFSSFPVIAQVNYPIPLSKIASEAIRGCYGGLDCIPSYSYPDMVSAEDASFMLDSELVLGVNLLGVQKAYPLSTLWFHEIANDVISDLYYTVAYCPLTRTGILFNAKQGDKIIEYGVSGFLFNNNLIMYDRTNTPSITYFPQMYFTGITEPRLGEQLEVWPSVLSTWNAWKTLHPNTLVVSSSLRGSYYPYGDYNENDDYILFPQEVDFRRRAKEMVFGVINSDFRARAYPFEDLAPAAVINDFFDEKRIAIFFDDESKLAVGFDSGSIPGYNVLEFELLSQPTITEFARDRQTGSIWNILGEAIQGTLVGKQLRQLEKAYSGFWFAWAAYFEPIEIYSPTTDVEEPLLNLSMPESFALNQNYPNPFNPETRIRYFLNKDAIVNLEIFTLLGEKVSTLVSARQHRGWHEVAWQANNLPSGEYIYRITADGFTEAKKMILMR